MAGIPAKIMKKLLLGIIAIGLLSGCRSPKTIIKEVAVHDTLSITNYQRDSIFMHDSIFMREYIKGDTLVQTTERWHTRYKDRVKYDSIFIHQTDTLKDTQVVKVEKELSWFDKTFLSLGKLSAALIVICAGIILWRKYQK